MSTVLNTPLTDQRTLVIVCAELRDGKHYDEVIRKHGLPDTRETWSAVLDTARSIVKTKVSDIYEARQALMLMAAKQAGFETVDAYQLDQRRNQDEYAVRRMLGDTMAGAAKQLAQASHALSAALDRQRGES